MATYFTDDFADFATDWTRRYNTSTTDYSVSGGDLIGCAGKATDWCNLSWNDIDSDANRDNIEFLISFTTTGTVGTTYILAGRGSGVDEAVTHYSFRYTATVIGIFYSSGSDASIAVATQSKTFSASTKYWMRARLNGTAVKVRAWADGASEPGAWDIDTTDSNVAGVGWGGFACYAVSANFQHTVHQIGIGTNGDTAPSSAGAASFGFLPRFPRPILNF